MAALNEEWQRLQEGVEQEPFPSLAMRKDRLTRLGALLTENEQALCEALNFDYGYRSSTQSSFADITTTLKSIRHARLNLRYWMTPQRRSTDPSLAVTGAKSFVSYYPKGVVGIISPWNFPLNLSLSPLTSVLAAGNRALIKPSEITPATSELIAQLVAQYFDGSEVAVACGGIDVAEALIQLPLDHLIYTGSTPIGRKIAENSAANLTPLTLELGGKCPVVASKTANIKHLAQRLLFGKTFNAGQICIAPDSVLLSSELLPQLLAALNALATNLNTIQTAGDHVEVINERHATRLDSLVSDAEHHGAQIVPLGKGQSLRLVIDPKPGARILSEEIFGPVLLIRTVGDFDAALAHLRHQPAPLAIYYFGESSAEWQKLNSSCPSGALVHNDIIMQYGNDDLPFGGVGDSGIGRYRGVFGFREFSNLRACYKSGWINVSALTSPPYPAVFQPLNKIMRYL